MLYFQTNLYLLVVIYNVCHFWHEFMFECEPNKKRELKALFLLIYYYCYYITKYAYLLMSENIRQNIY